MDQIYRDTLIIIFTRGTNHGIRLLNIYIYIFFLHKPNQINKN